MSRYIGICFLVLIWLFSWCYKANAFPVETHEIITEEITKNNQELDTKIKIYAGTLKGTDEYLNGNRVLDWLKRGSYDEDLSWGWYWRDNSLYSYFYDPLTNTSGVGDIWPSAYDWDNISNNENDWSWKKIC